MVNRRFGIGTIFALTAVLVVGGLVSATPLVNLEQTLQSVAIDCPGIKTRLNQAKVNDDLTRVNYGQAYESIIKNVFIPANTRLVTNRLDAGRLVNLTVNFETTLNLFRTDYQNYKVQMSAIQEIDCRQDSAKFYEKLQVIRAHRETLRNRLTELDQAIDAYLTEFRLVAK